VISVSDGQASAALAAFNIQVSSSGTPPVVTLTAPAAGATVFGPTVSGAVTLSATATGSAAIAGVQFKVDGMNVGSQVAASPYSYSWDSSSVSNGSHTVTAMARDAAGRQTTSTGGSVPVAN
jgi:hypothetical protein